MHVVKVIVFGKGEAGKSTFIKALAPEAVNIEHKGRTVGLDFGGIVSNGRKIHLYGTPGQLRFEEVREVLSLSADNAIMIFDGSTRIGHEDKKIITEIADLRVPFVSILNRKQTSSPLTTLKDIEGLCKESRHYICGLEGDVTNRNFAMTVINQLS